METVLFNGTPCEVAGKFPRVGDEAACFKLVTPQLTDVTCEDYAGKKLVLNIFPSLDTPVCAMSVRKFNQMAAGLDNTSVLCVSMDLPFADARFCSANNIENVTAASAFRSPEFGNKFGVKLLTGPLAGLLARAVIVLDGNRNVIYSQLVDEITHEPDYDAALAAIKNAK